MHEGKNPQKASNQKRT